MLTLLLLALFMLIMLSVLTRAARRRAVAQRRRQEEELRRMAEGGEPSPEGAFPFGPLFESLLLGTGARSYAYDERTGEWVEVTDEVPEPAPEPRGDDKRADGARRRRARRPRPAQAQPVGGLGGLLGGMGGLGDGSGSFEVTPPDELETFEDVGGMEGLKQETRDTVACCWSTRTTPSGTGSSGTGSCCTALRASARRSSPGRSPASSG